MLALVPLVREGLQTVGTSETRSTVRSVLMFLVAPPVLAPFAAFRSEAYERRRIPMDLSHMLAL